METPGRVKNSHQEHNKNRGKNEISLKPNTNVAKSTGEPKVFNWSLFGQMGLEFAIIIAMPLLIFIFLGNIFNFLGFKETSAWILVQKNSSKAYNVFGILFAIFLSFYTIISKIRKIERLIKNK